MALSADMYVHTLDPIRCNHNLDQLAAELHRRAVATEFVARSCESPEQACQSIPK
jgi:hypothetical protein